MSLGISRDAKIEKLKKTANKESIFFIKKPDIY